MSCTYTCIMRIHIMRISLNLKNEFLPGFFICVTLDFLIELLNLSTFRIKIHAHAFMKLLPRRYKFKHFK